MFALISGVIALENGLARTPPMGWMHWEQFRCEVDCVKNPKTCISESLFVDMIDHVAADGWLEYGYEYVDIDDCWMAGKRDENGELYPEPSRFPHGIPWLADYAHSKNVKLGIYNDYGTLTCCGLPGSKGYLLTDAQTFGKWKVDKLKMDGCYGDKFDMPDTYPGMAYFMNETKQPILYSCSWPAYDQEMNWSMLPPACNIWRNWNDIRAEWGSIKGIINKWGDMTETWAPIAGPGHWNDPDMLMIGIQPTSWVVGMTHVEEQTQFSMWSILAAPLIMSNDLRNISAESKAILRNKEVIAIDQDPLGKQGKRISPKGNVANVWVRELEGGAWCVALLNLDDKPLSITAVFSDFTKETSFNVRDLWAHEDLGKQTNQVKMDDIPAHACVLLKLTA